MYRNVIYIDIDDLCDDSYIEVEATFSQLERGQIQYQG